MRENGTLSITFDPEPRTPVKIYPNAFFRGPRRRAHVLAAILALLGSADSFSAQAGTPADVSAAQSGSISGRIQNSATGQYLNNARVTVKGTELVAFTDESGTYRLAYVPPGPVVLVVFYTGMEPQQIPVDVAVGGALERDIGLNSGSRYRNDTEIIKL